jgi:ADP-ribose pyrophosphatase YjhB (NUDIX family)
MSDPETNDEIRWLSARLRELAGNARQGLPHEIFLMLSSLTPMINVDLLLRNSQGQTLLTWRDDEFYGPGWHIPGGIIRFKEPIADRIAAVAASELGCTVSFSEAPLLLREISNPDRDVRGHFISLLYNCNLVTPPVSTLKFSTGWPKNGQWMWHDRCPENLIKVHEAYRPWIDASAGECSKGHSFMKN